MSHRSDRGVALLAAVVATGILGVLAVGLAYTSAVDQHLARNALAALQADALARSAAAAAATLLAERDPGDVDWPGAAWARGSGRQPLGAGWVDATIEDEARRLAVDLPELADARGRLLAALGLGDLAPALEDWLDADDVPRPLGAERDYYLRLAPPYAPRNAPVATLGELRLVRGFSSAALARVLPFLTVAPEPCVNPNTATREVLVAAVGVAAADRIVAARGRVPIDPARDGVVPPSDDPRGCLTARGTHYVVHALAAVGDVRRAWEGMLFAPAGVEPDLLAWRPVVPPP